MISRTIQTALFLSVFFCFGIIQVQSQALDIVNSTGDTLVHVENDGKVGIGQTSPSAKLDVVGNTELNGDVDINSDLDVDGGTLHVDGATNRVGIGTSSPENQLHIRSTGDAVLDIQTASGTNDISGIINFKKGNTANVGDGDELGAIPALGWESSRWNNAAEILFVAQGPDIGAGTVPGRIEFKTLEFPDLSPTTRMTIKDDGNVGIGTTSPSADLHIKQSLPSTARGIRLEFASNTDNWRTYIDAADDYNFAFNDALISYIDDADGLLKQISDRRLKTNIRRLDPLLDKVLKLSPSSYNFRRSSSARASIGFIAQEVEELFPEIVTEKEGLKTVAYATFGVLAIKALQEQQERMNAQQQTIEQLQEQLQKLEARISQLE